MPSPSLFFSSLFPSFFSYFSLLFFSFFLLLISARTAWKKSRFPGNSLGFSPSFTLSTHEVLLCVPLFQCTVAETHRTVQRHLFGWFHRIYKALQWDQTSCGRRNRRLDDGRPAKADFFCGGCDRWPMFCAVGLGCQRPAPKSVHAGHCRLGFGRAFAMVMQLHVYVPKRSTAGTCTY